MIIPDINLLVYAYNSDAPRHESACLWWEELLSGHRIVGLPWAVALGFTRVMTSPTVLLEPMSVVEALDRVWEWVHRPQVQIVVPGPRHLTILANVMTEANATGRLLTDAHLAALAIERQAELHSTDTDFARFPGLRWRNPLDHTHTLSRSNSRLSRSELSRKAADTRPVPGQQQA